MSFEQQRGTCTDNCSNAHHPQLKPRSFFDFERVEFHTKVKSGEPFTMAGLWESKVIDGIQKNTFSIVTTDANKLVAKIHNDPKASNTRRMPVILPKELQYDWLKPIKDELDKKAIQDLIKPYEDEEMEAHSVCKLLSKQAVGNKPEALEEVVYEDLDYPI